MPGSGPASPEEMPAEWLEGDRVSLLYQHPNLGHLLLIDSVGRTCAIIARFVVGIAYTSLIKGLVENGLILLSSSNN